MLYTFSFCSDFVNIVGCTSNFPSVRVSGVKWDNHGKCTVLGSWDQSYVSNGIATTANGFQLTFKNGDVCRDRNIKPCKITLVYDFECSSSEIGTLEVAQLSTCVFRMTIPTKYACIQDPTRVPTEQPTANTTKSPTVEPTKSEKLRSGILTTFHSVVIIVLCCHLLVCVLYWVLMNRRWEEEETRLADAQYVVLKEKEIKLSKFKLKHYAMSELLLGRQLASGTFSHVHKITIKKRNIEVAGKILDERLGITTSDFLREANLQQTVSENCNNIVSLIGIVREPKIILMEYYKNGSLDNALWEDYNQHVGDNGAEFPILTRLQFIVQLCRAVEHLHKHAIVHRDLASRNLLLSDDRKKVALADFGLARRINLIHREKNQTDTPVIPVTCPPETWNLASTTRRSYGLKTDIWSIGVTAFEIINKRPILNDLTYMKELEGTKAMIPKQLLRHDIKIGRSFGRTNELWSILLKCWRVNPKYRPQVGEVYDAIADLLKYPFVAKKHVYVSCGLNEVRKEFSDTGAFFSWSSSDKKAYSLESNDTVSTMCSQYSANKLDKSEVKYIDPEEWESLLVWNE